MDFEPGLRLEPVARSRNSTVNFGGAVLVGLEVNYLRGLLWSWQGNYEDIRFSRE
jgi:hypothetical protein